MRDTRTPAGPGADGTDAPALRGDPKIEAGQLVVPDKPGLGLAFDQAAMKRYQVG